MSDARSERVETQNAVSSEQQPSRVSIPDQSPQLELIERLLQAQRAAQQAAQQQEDRLIQFLLQQQQAQRQHQERLMQLVETSILTLCASRDNIPQQLEGLGNRTTEVCSSTAIPRRNSVPQDQVIAQEVQRSVSVDTKVEPRVYDGKKLPFGLNLPSSRRPFTILIEGNIGCGKTTLTERFLHHENVLTLLEPLEEYRNAAGENLFEMMYRDPGRYAYHFQHHAIMTMRKKHLIETKLPIKIMERSMFSCNCFIEARRRLGEFKNVEAHLLFETVRMLSEGSSNFHVDLILYLQLTPEKSYSRTISRARYEEGNISLDYVKMLHQVHEDWLVEGKFSTLPAPVLIMDAEAPADEVYTNFCKTMGFSHV